MIRGLLLYFFTYWREFLSLEILRESRIEVLGITLIEAVNVSFLFDLHVSVHQYEFSNGLQDREEEGKSVGSSQGLFVAQVPGQQQALLIHRELIQDHRHLCSPSTLKESEQRIQRMLFHF